MNDLLELPKTSDPDLEQEDPIVAHYVCDTSVMDGYVFGAPLVALCGRIWVPSHDPSDKVVCEDCIERKKFILAGGEKSPCQHSDRPVE